MHWVKLWPLATMCLNSTEFTSNYESFTVINFLFLRRTTSVVNCVAPDFNLRTSKMLLMGTDTWERDLNQQVQWRLDRRLRHFTDDETCELLIQHKWITGSCSCEA